MAKTISLIATAPYVGKHATAAQGEVLELNRPGVAVALLRTGKFKVHKRVMSTPDPEPEPETPRRRRTYRRRDMAAER